MNTQSEDIGGWFDSMISKDVERLREYSDSFDAWDNKTLEQLYGAFCKDFHQCEWKRVTKESIKQFEKTLRIQDHD